MADEPIPPPEPTVELTTEPVAPPPVRPENPAWTLWDVLAVGGFIVASVFVVQFVAVGIAHLVRPQLSLEALAKNAKLLVPAQLVSYVLALLAMIGILRSRGLEFWSTIQWNWPRRPIVLFLSGIPLSLAVTIAENFLPIPKNTPFGQYFSDAAAAYMLAFFGTLIAPLLEELFFRGFLYPALARHVGIIGSVVITSAIFAGIHAPQYSRAWAVMLLLFLVGVALTVVRIKANSVAASFLVHAGYNFSLFAVMYIASDHFRHLDKMH